MESQYLAEISEDGIGYVGTDSARAAAYRLHQRIKTGNTLVIVRVNNPRYKVK